MDIGTNGGDLERISALLVDVSKSVDSFRESQVTAWRIKGGVEVDAMLNRVGDAYQQLSHSDPMMRYIALSILVDHWKVGHTQQFVDACLQLAQNDDSVPVRCAAIGLLAVTESESSQIRHFLLDTVNATNVPPRCKMAAYKGLLQLMASSSIDRLRVARSFRVDESIDVIDWQLVRKMSEKVN